MALAVHCRGCGTTHDPLLACPSKDAIIAGLKKLLAETEAALGMVRKDLAAALGGKEPFDRAAYQREYMRRWRAKKLKKDRA